MCLCARVSYNSGDGVAVGCRGHCVSLSRSGVCDGGHPVAMWTGRCRVSVRGSTSELFIRLQMKQSDPGRGVGVGGTRRGGGREGKVGRRKTAGPMWMSARFLPFVVASIRFMIWAGQHLEAVAIKFALLSLKWNLMHCQSVKSYLHILTWLFFICRLSLKASNIWVMNTYGICVEQKSLK